jgi:hypothetical protein
MENKICSICNKIKPATSEFFTKNGRGGYRAECKGCRSASRSLKYATDEEYRQNVISQAVKSREKNIEKVKAVSKIRYYQNKEKIAQLHKEYYKKNAEKRKQYTRNYYQEHTEERRSVSCEYYHENKEQSLVRAQKYKESNRDRFICYEQSRRAKKEGLKNTLTESEWEYIKSYFENQCCYCGKSEPLAQEHFVPLSKGGSYAKENILPSCRICNSSKKDKDFQEWYLKHKNYSKERYQKIMEYINTHKVVLDGYNP